ncbi:ThiF family adenylyltransferase [Rhodococcus aetherivorans]|uniref:ThiF family adenylyltransferase n=1 Tax=Rhodococcus aetherivorans TaxID=191292 RepID=UPI00163B28B3|nr:ThiF family adenylyltransferase [Rhodococcus aetherivorans]MBC2586916.1 ThiF family adenylyltransferase [Rhodococcus aetherivorans]
MSQHSVAMTQETHEALARHLLRTDRQEDICLATYEVSTGARRITRVLHTVELPRDGERSVHGNATITGSYVLRVAAQAARAGRGLALLHSHPRGVGWQRLSGLDFDAEQSYAGLTQQVTGLPLVGMTLAGDETWSARIWSDATPVEVEAVRRVGTSLAVSWNDALRPPFGSEEAQSRTVSAWGKERHRDITRMRVLVVGVGSVGLDVVQRLAATGLVEIGVMDHDRIHEVNRDRMIGATRRDVRLHRRKVDVAARLARRAATARDFMVHSHHLNICTPEGRAAALDYDIVFSCVDRPWPRAVLNTLAYADLIPVIDGGIAIDTFDDGAMRSATRRSQTATPGRPCLACTGQIDMSEVALEMGGNLDDPGYIRGALRSPVSGRPNVAALCAAVSGSQLEHFVTLVARPGGQGVPTALRFTLAAHHLEHLPHNTQPYCTTETCTATGDRRADLIRTDIPWDRDQGASTSAVRRWAQNLVDRVVEKLLNA